MKVRIEHDGSKEAYKSRITNAETGEAIEHVGRIELDFNAASGPVVAKVTVYMPVIDLIVDAEIKHVCPCCGKDKE